MLYNRPMGNARFLWIRNGHLTDPASGLDGAFDLRLDTETGLVDRVVPAGQEPDAEGDTLDAAGLTVAPGLVDVHVHFRDPGFTHKEDIITGAAAAARGGFTSVIMMANTKPPIDNTDVLSYVLEKGAETGIRAYACGNVTKGMAGRELTDFEALIGGGAVGLTDDGLPIMDEGLVTDAMKRAAALQVPISFHEEDPAYVQNPGYNHGEASAHYGFYGADRMAEISMTERDIRLAGGTGARIDIQHISAAESVELVRKGKAAGIDVHAEATPHHFSLTEEAAIRYGTLAKMNPPLRTERDRLAIIEGLRDGTIDMIATDHAPHSTEEKNAGLTKAPSGIIGLETSLALGITELVNRGYLTMSQLMERMSAGPAAVYRLPAGRLSVGDPADLVLFDPAETFTVRREDFASKAENSPFVGRELRGRVHLTICGGKIIYSTENAKERMISR